MSLKARLAKLETRARPPQPPPYSERRERAFERLFRTLDEIGALVEREGELPWDDPRVREIIERHQHETRESNERSRR